MILGISKRFAKSEFQMFEPNSEIGAVNERTSSKIAAALPNTGGDMLGHDFFQCPIIGMALHCWGNENERYAMDPSLQNSNLQARQNIKCTLNP